MEKGVKYYINLYGALNLYQAIIELKFNPKILFVGSADEYGVVNENDLPIKETWPLCPVNPYAISKASADFLSYAYFKNYHLKIIRVRPFNHIGSRQAPDFVCSSFAKQIAKIEKGPKEPMLKVGNLEAKRDFTDVRDMVRAYWLAVNKCGYGKVYNISSEKVRTIQSVLDLLLSLTNKKINIKQDSSRMRPPDLMILQGDCSKFKERTGWKPQIPFKETIQDLLNYWRVKI
ncbi:GDP-6-deoxy-D-mannose reductase [subsurface metagenome]